MKDVYYSIRVDESSQKYLKFIWKELLYQFCVLPNGLSPCPRWFTNTLVVFTPKLSSCLLFSDSQDTETDATMGII